MVSPTAEAWKNIGYLAQQAGGGQWTSVLGFDSPGPVGSGFQHLKELGLLSDLLGQSIRFPWAELAAGLRTFTGVPVCKRWLLVSCARAWFVVSIKRTAFTTSMSLRNANLFAPTIKTQPGREHSLFSSIAAVIVEYV